MSGAEARRREAWASCQGRLRGWSGKPPRFGLVLT